MQFTIKNQADGESADIHINDFIGDWIDDYFGFGVTSKAFIKEIQDLPESVKTIRLHVNSPGGDVMAASHIANTLRDQQASKGRAVEILVEGAAWSAATIVTSAGNPTKIADNAIMMVHNPWLLTAGTASELRRDADELDKFRDSMVATYQWKSHLSEQKLLELMAAETWMDADEAIANGLADQKIEGLRAAACFSAGQIEKIPEKMRDIRNVPEKYRAQVRALLGADDSHYMTWPVTSWQRSPRFRPGFDKMLHLKNTGRDRNTPVDLDEIYRLRKGSRFKG